MMLRLTTCIAALSALLPAIQAQGGPPGVGFPSPWGGGGHGWDEAYEKARDFVGKLTLVEKVNLTTGTGWMTDRCIGMTGSVPRLGFRGFCLEDGPLGVRYTDGNSAFPAGINVAATWSRDLMRRRGVAMGEEFRGKGIDVQLGPVAGPLGRVPAGGRNWEGFSPDPYLTGVGMAETVQGIQSAGVIACAKHYILNEQEHYRGSVDVTIDDRTMHELYLWPFADAVRAGVGSVMCSYNKIGGEYSCDNEWTTNYLLKNELNFQGFVMSDWNAQHTDARSALAGLDMTMPGDGARGYYTSFWGGSLTELVLRGEVPQWRLDDMVVRIMAAYYKVNTGKFATRPEINFSAWVSPNQTVGPLYFKANSTITEVNKHVNVQADHAELIREIGAKSIVLLKNVNQTLPLVKPGSIAVIGEDAQDVPGGPNACEDRRCNNGTLAMGYGSATANFPYLISPIMAIRKQAEADNTSLVNIESNWDLDAAKQAASKAEVALVFANANSGEGFITIDGNNGDRNNLSLWNGGDDLIRAVAGANPNTVVVLHTVGPVILDYAKAHPNITAILWAGLPGQESGSSLADVLYGRVNPQGRSPFTWGRSAADYGAQLMYKAPPSSPPAQNFSEGVFIDYRYFQRARIGPVYEFGFGLSYTRFRYANLTVETREPPPPYGPSGGMTPAAPTYGEIDKAAAANMQPEGFRPVKPYVYPWINGPLDPRRPNVSQPTTTTNGSAQPILPAGGAPGGNPGLYDVLYTLNFFVTNEGKVAGTDIPQLYVQLGGDENPWGVLRGFDEVSLEPGETKPVTFNLTRRDVSNWDTEKQDWVINGHEKFVFVGYSSTAIALNSSLPALK